ncbi:MAG: hypothetical protein KA339_06590 [Candidatus Kapabacteria bacterium]|nr:hypothetical protein [Candidatus Kapabacteria bacterium]
MALWQYTFQIVTKESYEYLHKDSNPVSGEDGFDEEPYWLLTPTKRSLFDGISSIISKGKSWSDALDVDGNLESNCLNVLFNTATQEVESVSFRIDYTRQYEHVCRAIIEFCILKGMVVLDEKLEIVPMSYEAIKALIEDSPQRKRYDQMSNYKPE